MGNSRETKKSPLHDAGTSEPSQINGHGCGQGHRHKSTPLEVDGEHDSYDNDSDSNDPITGTGTEVSSRSPCCALCCNCLATDENGNPSNESLLSTAFLSFLIFTIAQSFGAYFAESEAMMADTAAMMVDAITYGFNLYAERQKATATKVQKLHLELVPPLISVTTLIIVNIFVTRKSIIMIRNPVPILPADQPKLVVMFAFSTLNLVLDLINVTCFARANRLFGFEIDTGADEAKQRKNLHSQLHDNDEEEDWIVDQGEKEHIGDISGNTRDIPQAAPMSMAEQNRMSLRRQASGNLSQDADKRHSQESNDNHDTQLVSNGPANGVQDPHEVEDGEHSNSEEEDGREDKTNLNMCSAYTHVFADTLRSIAVIVASCLAYTFNDISPIHADAVAALVVSFLILLSLIPLFQGLVHTFSELKFAEAELEAQQELKIAAYQHDEQREHDEGNGVV